MGGCVKKVISEKFLISYMEQSTYYMNVILNIISAFYIARHESMSLGGVREGFLEVVETYSGA